jgi:hypothetical protein
MEAAALNAPPEWLEKIVLRLIPPCAREGIAGDLWETYVSPRQYAAEALRTVPLVVFSQMRRNLNLPVLLLQVSLICFCLGNAAGFALLPVLMLRDAYQEAARPCPRRAMRNAILVASAALVFLQFASMNIHTAIQFGMDRTTWTSLLFVGPMLSPLMGLLRTGLILDGDRRSWITTGAQSAQELAAGYRAFARRARWHNVLEGAALVAVAGFAFFYLPVTPAIALTGLYLVVAFYLLLDGAPRALPATCDFTALRALYQRALLRRQQLRRFLWWLWFTPALAALHLRMVEGAMTDGKPMLAVFGSVAALLLCFLVVALNREYGGRVREQVGLLDRMRERLA